MKNKIAKLLKIQNSVITVKATTNEKSALSAMEKALLQKP